MGFGFVYKLGPNTSWFGIGLRMVRHTIRRHTHPTTQVYSHFVLVVLSRLVLVTMASRESHNKTPGRPQPPVQDRTRATMISPVGFVDSARGRQPFSSSISSSLPHEDPATPNLEFAPRTSGHRTDSQISALSDLESTNNPETTKVSVGGGETGNGDDDMRVQDLVARLRIAQSLLDTHNGTPEFVRSVFPDVPPDHHSFPPDSHRGRLYDVPERFHAGRESLSVRQNVTIRDTKRPKERLQDKEYKQRYSLTPGQHVGGLDFDRQSSSGNFSSPARIANRQVFQSPSLVPSPKCEDKMGGNRDNRSRHDGGPEDASISITLIHEGNRHQHQVWPDMPVAQLTQEAAGIF
jgi:hypothetical protein